MSYHNISRAIEEGEKIPKYFKSRFPFVRKWAKKKCDSGHSFVLIGTGENAWQGRYLCTNCGLQEDQTNLSFTD